MEKVIVIGCPGAGKSTFARRLRDITGLPLFYLDQIWHKPDRTNVSREDFDAALAQIMAKDRWLIDGNYNRTLERRMVGCDTVFLLDYPTHVCLDGASARVGRTREEIPWTEETLDPEFAQYIAAFAQDQLPRIYELLAQYGAGRKVVIFRSREEADTWLQLYESQNACYTE